MTEGDANDAQAVVRADSLGRVQCARDRREAIMDAFERSALSGPTFAEVHGIKYQTFATWRQKRKRERERSESPVSSCTTSSSNAGEGSFTFLEVALASSTSQSEASSRAEANHGGTERDGLSVELPHGARMLLRWAGDVDLAARLIKALG